MQWLEAQAEAWGDTLGLGAIRAKVGVETAGVREMAQGDEGREGKWAEDGQVSCLRVKVQAKGEETVLG